MHLTCFHDVAGCAGDIGHDGALAARPGVEQTRLSDIWSAHQGNTQTAVQQLPLPCRRQRVLFHMQSGHIAWRMTAFGR